MSAPLEVRTWPHRMLRSYMGPQDPKDVARNTARDLSALVGELAALKADATHWRNEPEYAALRHRLEAAHAAAEAALVEAEREAGLVTKSSR